ncbi:MAG: HlyD family efflux transporter periplasmic adaptor subunit [Sedimentibacter saalensis]|uniref:efflux RND transporter periplasmic adaptor subunit n=1 Tax=Sedimentibacter saalensis TaxID=130788 RepID=UPI002B1F9AC2|nr:biotin/lipoyl-binding protein [Sedimentibacter saalensis]MEA5095305.1 HlyD family efflux transporter periplasmic adaptor subunit [Sedimentibacter saalensis]
MRKFLVLLALMLFFSGCSREKSAVSDRAALVETITVNLESTDTYLKYVGIINSDSLKKYSFKSSGILKSIYVQQGQSVDEGEVLLELDKSDLKIQTDAAKNQADAAYSQYEKALSGAQDEDISAAKIDVEKAQAAYDYALLTFNDTKILFEEGAVSQSSFKEAELGLNIAEKELDQSKEVLNKTLAGTRSEDISSAKSQYEMSYNNYEAALKLYEEATLVCDVNGYVADILYKEGELIPAGYPIILVQSKNQIATVGLTQEDSEKVSVGTLARITVNNEVYSGKITNINQTPDEATMTFTAEISIDTDKKFYIGSIAEVELITGKSDGIYLEIPYILNDGENYVYILEEGKSIRKNIEVLDIVDDKALIRGLSDNDELIINGTDNIKDGSHVMKK